MIGPIVTSVQHAMVCRFCDNSTEAILLSNSEIAMPPGWARDKVWNYCPDHWQAVSMQPVVESRVL